MGIFDFFSGILNLGPSIASVLNKIQDTKLGLAVAANDKERIDSQERIIALQSQAIVMQAEANSPLNKLIRAWAILPFIIYNGVIVLWDGVLGLGTHRPLSAEMLKIEMICFAFYFLHSLKN